MVKILFNAEKNIDNECSMALRRFIGHMEGVKSIGIEEEKITIIFDDSKITKEDRLKLTKDCLEKLGYKLLE